MNELDEQFIKTERQRDLLHTANSLAETFIKRADDYDRSAAFPFENFEDLKAANFLSLSIPEKFGGYGISLYEFLLVQEKLAQGDAATALSLGWHVGTMMHQSNKQSWDEETFARVCREIVESKKLLNATKSEIGTGSPARGGKPETTARKQGNMWVINGRKNFASMAPALDYFIISATIEETDEVGDFLIPRGVKGLSIEETWDTLSMRATRSDDLLIEDVTVEENALLEIGGKSKKPSSAGWLLHIPACYIGIAIAARNEAVEYAKSYQPNHLTHPIKDLTEVRQKVAEMDIELLAARHFMYGVANSWDCDREKRAQLGPELAAVKYAVTNTAIKVVDMAMRLLGGQSLYAKNNMQRFYRDVRAGLHNPPGDDVTLKIIAKRAFDD